MRLRVHRNLNVHKEVMWSLSLDGTERVVAEATGVALTDAEFVVSRSRWERMKTVLGKRWVVGWVRGEVAAVTGLKPAGRTDSPEKRAAWEHLLTVLRGQLSDEALEGERVRCNLWEHPDFAWADGSVAVKAAAAWTMPDGKCRARR